MIVALSQGLVASESIKAEMDREIEGGLRRIEFGFVLLPDESASAPLKELTDKVYSNATNLPNQDYNSDWGSYVNIPVTLPHVSIGQYGCLAVEEPKLKLIVDEIAKEYCPLMQTMAAELSVTDENIFLDFENIRDKTDPVIVLMYKKLREEYMIKVKTRFPIAQAMYEKYINCDDPDELLFIDKHFQNWGTPEGNRIRPHFTLLYNYTADRKELELSMTIINLVDELKTMNFSKIGIVEIDCRGNPRKVLHTARLSK